MCCVFILITIIIGLITVRKEAYNCVRILCTVYVTAH